MRKNTLFSIALLAIGLFWASCKGTDPGPSPLLQTENDLLSNGGIWKADTTEYTLRETVAGSSNTLTNDFYWKIDTLIFQRISTDTVIKRGFGGLRRGLLIRQHTIGGGGGLEVDTMNWQASQASVIDKTPRIVIFYDPGPNETQYSFTLKERSASKIVMTSERDLITPGGFPGFGKRRYNLSR